MICIDANMLRFVFTGEQKRQYAAIEKIINHNNL